MADSDSKSDSCDHVCKQLDEQAPVELSTMDGNGLRSFGLAVYYNHDEQPSAKDVKLVGQFLREKVRTSDDPTVVAVSASYLSFLVSTLEPASIPELRGCMRTNFVKMSSGAPGKGRLCLAMCYFGGDDPWQHGLEMRNVLEAVEDDDEKVRLTTYVCGKNLHNLMKKAIYGYLSSAKRRKVASTTTEGQA